MSSIEHAILNSSSSRKGGSLPYFRWLCLAVLFIAELLFFSTRFDTRSLFGIDSNWATLLGNASLAGQFAISAIAAIVVFGGRSLAASLRRIASESYGAAFPWFPFIFHLISLAAFYRLCSILFEGNPNSMSQPYFWTGCWIAAGAGTFIFWLLTLFPFENWRTLFQGRVGYLFAAAAIALAALAAGRLADLFWQPLAEATFWIVQRLLQVFYSDVIADPATLIIGTGKFSVQIAPACSGYEGIGLISIFLVAFLWWFRDRLRFPRAFLLIPFGIAAIWLSNSVRIAGLIAVGSSISHSVAAGGFHSQAGWLAFNAIALGICALALHLPIFAAREGDHHTVIASTSNPTAAYLAPFLAIVAATMLTAAMGSDGFDRFYALRVLAVFIAIWAFRFEYRREKLFSGNWSWSAVGIGAVVFVGWMLLESLRGVNPAVSEKVADSVATLSAPWFIAWLALRAIGSIIAVPIAEELAFRGYLARRMMADDFETVSFSSLSWFSCLGSSVLFGLLHGRWIAGIFAGALFWLALRRRGRLIDAVVAHSTANALISCYVLSTQKWWIWS